MHSHFREIDHLDFWKEFSLMSGDVENLLDECSSK